MVPRRARISGSWTFVSPNSRTYVAYGVRARPTTRVAYRYMSTDGQHSTTRNPESVSDLCELLFMIDAGFVMRRGKHSSRVSVRGTHRPLICVKRRGLTRVIQEHVQHAAMRRDPASDAAKAAEAALSNKRRAIDPAMQNAGQRPAGVAPRPAVGAIGRRKARWSGAGVAAPAPGPPEP